MIVSVRLNEEDKRILDEITFKLNNDWSLIFGKGTQTTSDTIRSCIRRTYYDLFESDKKDSNTLS